MADISVDTTSVARAMVRIRTKATVLVDASLTAFVPALAVAAKDDFARVTPRSPDDPLQPDHQHAADQWYVSNLGPGVAGVGNSARPDNGSPYIQFLFEDTAAHMITPLYGNALHFFAGGTEVFTRSVEHPGTKANPALVADLAAQGERAQARLTQMGDAIMAELAASITT